MATDPGKSAVGEAPSRIRVVNLGGGAEDSLEGGGKGYEKKKKLLLSPPKF